MQPRAMIVVGDRMKLVRSCWLHVSRLMHVKMTRVQSSDHHTSGSLPKSPTYQIRAEIVVVLYKEMVCPLQQTAFAVLEHAFHSKLFVYVWLPAGQYIPHAKCCPHTKFHPCKYTRSSHMFCIAQQNAEDSFSCTSTGASYSLTVLATYPCIPLVLCHMCSSITLYSAPSEMLVFLRRNGLASVKNH
jgi:hypothetical protein